MFDSNFAPPLQAIINSITEAHEINLFMLRIDLNHPTISGNKLYKLKYNIEEAQKLQKKTLLTFGGAFSNHIAATAAAGKEYKFKTIGIIRGEPSQELNPTLKLAQKNGMHLHFVSREVYRDKNKLHNYVTEKFANQDFYLIPEGGSNELGVLGCKEITNAIPIDFNTICCACGTGATFSGITMNLKEQQNAIGFQILKGKDYIKTEVENWHQQFNYKNVNWKVNENNHFGGYAKTKKDLNSFIIDFELQTGIPLDFIYTGKMMYGIFQLTQQNYFKKGETIIAVHTGGLQGNPS